MASAQRFRDTSYAPAQYRLYVCRIVNLSAGRISCHVKLAVPMLVFARITHCLSFTGRRACRPNVSREAINYWWLPANHYQRMAK